MREIPTLTLATECSGQAETETVIYSCSMYNVLFILFGMYF